MTTTDLAPWPTRPEDATADRLARHYTTAAQRSWQRIDNAMHRRDAAEGPGRVNKDTPEAKTANKLFAHEMTDTVNKYTIAFLLRALQEHASEHADQVALDLCESLEAGSHVTFDLYEWLTEYGINPDAAKSADSAEAVAR